MLLCIVGNAYKKETICNTILSVQSSETNHQKHMKLVKISNKRYYTWHYTVRGSAVLHILTRSQLSHLTRSRLSQHIYILCNDNGYADWSYRDSHNYNQLGIS